MYQALYRKYRPKTFNDVVGQKYVVETLKNSIINRKINHAYMFFGPRGIGKTTMAKILAKAINCTDSKDGNPCEKCENCLAAGEKECVDIIEIDAASNNGVDEIREIRNKVNLVPTKLKYKVYIIDEVHMLTQGAFNALLKTLEEPPSHIIFILATTDPQKVSDTIISRCQCFSFKRISDLDNLKRLKYICDLEHIEIDDEVLKEISIYSDGGLRDSLGLLDKLSSYKNTKISLNDFYDLNDMIENEELDKICKNIETKNISLLINQLEGYYIGGKNIVEIINQLLIYLKNKVIDYYVKNTSIENLEVKEILLNLLNEKMFDIKKSSRPHIYVEILLLQFINNLKNISREIFSQEIKTDSYEDKQLEKLKEEEIQSSNKLNNEKQKDSDNEETKDQSIPEQLESDLSFYKNLMKIRINNILADASKEEKQKDTQNIEKLNDYIFDSTRGYLVSEILNGVLCASSSKGIILSYEYASVVDQNIRNLTKINQVYNELTFSDKKLAFITFKEWEEEKKKYIEFTKQGNKYTIKEEPTYQENTKKEEQEKNLSTTLGMFGNIVEIK